MENQSKQNSYGRSLNTLAQSGTKNFDQVPFKKRSKGSDLFNEEALKNRSKRKMITQMLALSLIDIADKSSTDIRKKSYWNTYYCQNVVQTASGRLYGKYCKNRFCTICCSIRKALLINKYLPEVKRWETAFFVTLTAKSVSHKSLAKRMRDLNRGFRKITSKYRKRAIRKTGTKLTGIKSLECNFNPARKTYNPHLHIIVPSEEMADILIKEWLSLCTIKFASPKAQHKRKVIDTENDLIEIIKYGTKIFTEPDINTKLGLKGDQKIYAAALDKIFIAMKGIRIFERFGFNLSEKNNEAQPDFLDLSNLKHWLFDPSKADWIDIESDGKLSNYEPSPHLSFLLNNCINTSLE